jgi:hypothetical protein
VVEEIEFLLSEKERMMQRWAEASDKDERRRWARFAEIAKRGACAAIAWVHFCRVQRGVQSVCGVCSGEDEDNAHSFRGDCSRLCKK